MKRNASLFAAGLLLVACIPEEVGGPIDRVELAADYTLVVGETASLPSPVFKDAHGHSTGNDSLKPTWEVGDTSLVRLTSDGKLVAGEKPGSTTLTVRAGSLSDVAALTVSTDFHVWPNAMRLIPGGARKPVVHALVLATGRTIPQGTWESSNPAIATVASDGTITGVANGETTIVARRGAFTASTRVVVAAYTKPLVFTDVGMSPRGICATEASGTWCWGEHAAPQQSPDRCVGIFQFPQTDVACSASPVQMTTTIFAELVSPRSDSWASASQEPVGPYGRAVDGKLYQVGANGPTGFVSGFTFKTFWAGRPMCGADLNGKGYCWNTNFDGYMGVGTVQPMGPWPQSPTAIISDKKFKQFVRGESMCGLTEDGIAYCWGPNLNRGAGIGPNAPARPQGCDDDCLLVPTQTATEARFTMLAGGGNGAPGGGGDVCGLTASSQLYCWSSKSTANGSPVLVNAGTFTRIESGRVICGIDAAGAASCMAGPGGPSLPIYGFAKLLLPFPVTRIVAGDKISCAISATNSKLYCWGAGALGGGESVAAATADKPVEVWGQR